MTLSSILDEWKVLKDRLLMCQYWSEYEEDEEKRNLRKKPKKGWNFPSDNQRREDTDWYFYTNDRVKWISAAQFHWKMSHIPFTN